MIRIYPIQFNSPVKNDEIFVLIRDIYTKNGHCPQRLPSPLVPGQADGTGTDVYQSSKRKDGEEKRNSPLMERKIGGLL